MATFFESFYFLQLAYKELQRRRRNPTFEFLDGRNHAIPSDP